jgi:UDP-N-acetylmuramoylalanine--D-glutamate ligase
VLEKCDDEVRRAQAAELADEGIAVVLGGVPDTPPPGTGLVVTTPGWRPDTPLLTAALAAGIPVLGDVELAWRLRPVLPDGRRQEWLAVTGTNGKTTTVKMLAAMLAAAGHRTIAAGNVGVPLTAVVTAAEPYPVLAVELSSFQLHWSTTLRPLAAVVLNVAPDHLDWHGGMDAYAAAKGRIYAPGTIAICNADDGWSARLAADAAAANAAAAASAAPASAAPATAAAQTAAAQTAAAQNAAARNVAAQTAAARNAAAQNAAARNVAALSAAAHNAAARRPVVTRTTADAVVGFTLGVPEPGQLGVADGMLTDRAFGAPGESTVLAQVSDVRPAAPHNVANALAAAALARAYGAGPAAVTGGLRAFEPEPHRISLVGQVGGVDYVDDSKATNPHAAAASLAAYPKVVWVAGGLLKGAEVDDLVSAAAGRLRAVVLLGADRAKIRQALARHAPNVPVTEVTRTDTGVMDHVVTEAAALARPGDTVLLAPAAASLDMFANYGARGDAFAASVHKLAAAP